MKKVVKEIGIYILVFISLIAVFILALLLTSLIPSKYIEKNVRSSSEILVENGEKVLFNLGYKKDILFYFTDALMINTAYSIDHANPYYSFMMARKNYIPGQTINEYEETKYHVGTSDKYKNKNGDTFQTQELYGLMHGDNIIDSYDYARYWHGYLVFLRPLLLIFDIQGIRIFFIILVILLSMFMVYLIAKRISIFAAIAYAITLIAVNVWIVANSVNEITTFLIAIIFGILILLKKGKFKRPELIFMCIGMITSYLDLLTTPLITLGYTLPLYILLNLKEENKRLFIKFIKICILWAVRIWLNMGAKMGYSRYNIRKKCHTRGYVTVYI